jgi:hypothetical protein
MKAWQSSVQEELADGEAARANCSGVQAPTGDEQKRRKRMAADAYIVKGIKCVVANSCLSWDMAAAACPHPQRQRCRVAIIGGKQVKWTHCLLSMVNSSA